MNSTEELSSINPTLVGESARACTIANMFGNQHAVAFESLCYAWMTRLASKEYTGGYWNYYTLDNGGFYMAPRHYRDFHLSHALNYFEGTLTPDGSGIIASLFALNQLCNRTGIDEHIELYHALRDYVSEHPERRLIMKAID